MNCPRCEAEEKRLETIKAIDELSATLFNFGQELQTSFSEAQSALRRQVDELTFGRKSEKLDSLETTQQLEAYKEDLEEAISLFKERFYFIIKRSPNLVRREED